MRGQALLLESPNCRSLAQVRRDHRRSLGKPPAWSRVSYEVRPGCSGLFPVRTLPCLNLSNFSVVISIACCLPQRAVVQSTTSPPFLQAEQAQLPQPHVRTRALVSDHHSGNSINLLPAFLVFEWEVGQAIYHIIGEHAFMSILCTRGVDCCMECA